MRKTLFILITALVAFGCSSDKSSVVEETAQVLSTTETPMTTTEEYVEEGDASTDVGDYVEEEGDDSDEYESNLHRELLVEMVTEIIDSDIGFVNVDFSGCIVDAVVAMSGDDYEAAFENALADDDAYAMEFEAAAIGCISFLSPAELGILTSASTDEGTDEGTLTPVEPSDPSDLVGSDYEMGDVSCAVGDSDPKVTSDWPYESGMFAGPSLQADARLGAHADYDRWVLEFSDDSTPPTGWEVMWTGDVVEVGFGESDWDPTAEVDGSQYLMINMKATSGLGFPEDEWYDGPWDLYGSDAGTENIVHAASFGSFEGYSTWAIGANEESAFHVFALESPARLVVDICH